MNYKLISSQAVIANVQDRFNPDYGGWIARAPKWITNGLAKVDSEFILVPAHEEVEVASYKGKLPCSLETLIGIKKDGYRLRRLGTYNHNEYALNDPTSDETYELSNDNYFHTSFEEGTVTVYYLRPPMIMDNDLGIMFPMIPDNFDLIENLSWYILMIMLSRGYKHPVFNYMDAEQRWKDTKKEAEQSLNAFDDDTREMITRVFTTFLSNPNSHFDDTFRKFID